MSFTAEVKQELQGLPLDKACCQLAELSALSACLASLHLLGRGRLQLRYRSQSPGIIKRVYSLLKSGQGVRAFPRFFVQQRFGRRRVYELMLSPEDSRTVLAALHPGGMERSLRLKAVPGRLYRRICCQRAWIRGAFLGCGSLQSPDRGYRAEFSLGDEAARQYLLKLLERAGVKASQGKRREELLVYVLDGESLVTLLSLMGASRATLHVENLRAQGELKRSLNRVTNCDNANMSKQLDAARQQLEDINAISRERGLNSLPPALEQLARLRLSNPDAKLEELGQMMQPPLSKSGAQYRMGQLTKIAKALGGPAPDR